MVQTIAWNLNQRGLESPGGVVLFILSLFIKGIRSLIHLIRKSQKNFCLLEMLKNIFVDEILIQLDRSDIDLSGTDDEYKDDDIEYVPETAKSSSDSELLSSDTDKPDAIPSTSSSALAKQLEGKNRRNHCVLRLQLQQWKRLSSIGLEMISLLAISSGRVSFTSEMKNIRLLRYS